MTKLASNPSALQSPAIESGEPLSLIGLDRVDLARVIEPLGVKPFRAQQIFRWIYNHGVSDFSEMTNISKNLQSELAKNFSLARPAISQHQKSDDGTQKWQKLLFF